MGAVQKKTVETLGRLKSFGLQHPWQAAFLLPTQWDDMRTPLTSFNINGVQEGGVLVQGYLHGEPQTRFSSGTPRLIGCLNDDNGYQIGFCQFGDTRDFLRDLKKKQAAGQKINLWGDIAEFNGKWWIRNLKLVNNFWVGKLRPVYPGKVKVINPDTVRKRVLSLMGRKVNVEQSVQWLTESLGEFGNPEQLAQIAKCPGWTLRQIIGLAHIPKDPETAEKATQGLERLAGLGIVQQARQNTPHIVPSLPISRQGAGESYRLRIKSIPFDLTGEQKQAVGDTVLDMLGALPARRLLSGDVGTGKTAVYGLASAICADQGGRVAILLPNQVLAEQVASEIYQWWPDISMQLVTGETASIPEGQQILIGTTALLFRTTDKKFDFVVVDEQQKFSREQREKLIQKGTHLLEVSATCIPRSQALMRFGVIKVSKLTQCHVKKHIETVIRTHDDRVALFNDVRQTINDGGQVLMVYPRKTDDPEKDCDLPAVEDALISWGKAFPGQVVMAHGGMSDKDKTSVMQQMKNGEASILLATTVVEVGVNIPNLKRVVVVHAERYGLSTLHQIRGRAARTGGKGYCDLYLPTPAKPNVFERLNVLVKTNNGFEVSEADLRIRGAGNLSRDSSKQTGADDTFLFGRGVNLDILDELIQETKKC
jgi:ATP-dependent DNA helicase RecG